MVLTQPNFIGTDAIATVVAGSWRGRRRTDIQTSGLARHNLEAALWATARSASFDQAVTLAIDLNSKNPVLAALTGQLSGALLGARAIPTRWRRDLPLHAMIHSVTHGLLRQS
jgi:ADP-ribosyl-[dinitrogen reductase] hydrolase